MIIIFSPVDGEEERYDARSLLTSEASIVQRTIGMKWGEVQQGLETDDPESLRAVVWVLKKRGEPTLRFGDFDPVIGTLTTRMDHREVAEYLEGAFALADTDPDVSRAEVAKVCQRIVRVAADPEHAERLIAEMARDPKEQDGEEFQLPPQEGSPSPSTPTSTSSALSGSGSSPTS